MERIRFLIKKYSSPMQVWTRLVSVVRDLRYGGRFLGGSIPTRYAHMGAHHVTNTDYRALPLLFEGLIKADDVLVDVGCGKGRVINWWLSLDLNNSIIGLELDEGVAEGTRRRLEKYRNVSILAGDAIANLPPSGTLFYLFNPFGKDVVRRFAQRVLECDGGRKTIVYYNCEFVDVFRQDPRWRVRDINLGPNFYPAAIIERVSGFG